jgi:hypothetical protein
MPTINSKEIIDELVKHNGLYPNDPTDYSTPDPRVIKIVEYTNMAGKQTWGVIYEGMSLDYYAESEYVRNPKTYWEFLPAKMK